MKTKGTFGILTSKYSLVFKVVVFLIIITLLISILAAAVFLPTLRGLIKDIKGIGLGNTVKDYLRVLIQGIGHDGADQEVLAQAELYNQIVEKIELVFESFDEHSVAVGLTITFLILCVYIFMYMYHLVYYSISDVINAFMSSNSKFGFASNLVANIKKNSLFSLLYSIIILVYYIVGFSIALLLGLLAGKLNGYFGVFVMYLLSVVVLSLRRATFSAWIPLLVVDGKGIIESLVENFKIVKKRFIKLLAYYFNLYICSIAVLGAGSFFTLGVGTIFFFSAILIVMQIYDMIEFYSYRGYKYYVDDQTVVDPKRKYKDAVLSEPYNPNAAVEEK